MGIFNLQVSITIQVLPSGMCTPLLVNSNDLWGVRARDGHFPHRRAVENQSEKGCAKLKVEELPWKAVGKDPTNLLISKWAFPYFFNTDSSLFDHSLAVI